MRQRSCWGSVLGVMDSSFLFVCSLQTNVALVSPLLRLENNHCHIEESEYVLKKSQKYSELIILYEKKGLHQKGKQLSMETGRIVTKIGLFTFFTSLLNKVFLYFIFYLCLRCFADARRSPKILYVE